MKKADTKITELYDLTHTMAKDYLMQFTYPWEALAGLSDFITELGKSLNPEEYELRGENVWVHKTAVVFDSAYLHGPVIVGPKAQVRQCAFIRESALIGEGAVVGNSTELKNVILFDAVETPHYNYVGDSILGYHAHMGAGSITSNVKADKKHVQIHTEEGDIDTGRKKVGAMLGDRVEIGCGTVLNPGAVVGRDSNVYPLTSLRGCVDRNSICKRDGEISPKRED
ncbi:transferase hexapeptide (six repeat-containing protein) [[Clostridium] aminophilum]|uniref:Transferase hexapeptide (Six repeat-containing protein) n=1 Tax=[Clostridium] aminophilum TaxID=1526 RepID=A0A1I0APB5_9FIRM|nr:UDP-N-acetylglucosamine pyrophosphorylase [[Clostridium] aminophilum]SES96249.1 transferase hexapeptide (six repeat-containing protein) [[Clostridium] aminophilum]